jgi:hypothetical protein
MKAQYLVAYALSAAFVAFLSISPAPASPSEAATAYSGARWGEGLAESAIGFSGSCGISRG